MMAVAPSAVCAQAGAHSFIQYGRHALHEGPVELWVLCGRLVAIVEDQGQVYGHALLHIYRALHWRCADAAWHCDASLPYSRSLFAEINPDVLALGSILF